MKKICLVLFFAVLVFSSVNAVSLTGDANSKINSVSAKANSKVNSASAKANSKVNSASAKANSKVNSASVKTNEKAKIMNDMLAELQKEKSSNSSLTTADCYKKYDEICEKKYKKNVGATAACKSFRVSVCSKVVK